MLLAQIMRGLLIGFAGFALGVDLYLSLRMLLDVFKRRYFWLLALIAIKWGVAALIWEVLVEIIIPAPAIPATTAAWIYLGGLIFTGIGMFSFILIYRKMRENLRGYLQGTLIIEDSVRDKEVKPE